VPLILALSRLLRVPRLIKLGLFSWSMFSAILPVQAGFLWMGWLGKCLSCLPYPARPDDMLSWLRCSPLLGPLFPSRSCAFLGHGLLRDSPSCLRILTAAGLLVDFLCSRFERFWYHLSAFFDEALVHFGCCQAVRARGADLLSLAYFLGGGGKLKFSPSSRVALSPQSVPRTLASALASN